MVFPKSERMSWSEQSGRLGRVDGRGPPRRGGARGAQPRPVVWGRGYRGPARGLSPFVCGGLRRLPALALRVCLGLPVWVCLCPSPACICRGLPPCECLPLAVWILLWLSGSLHLICLSACPLTVCVSLSGLGTWTVAGVELTVPPAKCPEAFWRAHWASL